MFELLIKFFELIFGCRSCRKLFIIYRIIYFYIGFWYNDIVWENCNGV